MTYNFDRIIRLTQPTVEPVTLEQAKEQLRCDGDDENDYITSLISVARDYIETYTGQYFSEATFALFFDNFPASDFPMDIQIPGVDSIDSVTYLDTDQANQTISTGITLDGERRQMRYNSTWPTAISVRIEVTAGVDNSSSPAFIPYAIQQAILLTITDLHNTRATLTSMQMYRNDAAEALAYPYRTRMGI